MKKIFVGDYKIGEREKSAIMKVLDSGRISEYVNVLNFEKKFAEIIGVKYCTLVNSGTSALIAGLTALLFDDRFPKVKKGSKVITTPLTYIATSNAIKLVGLEPIFIDVNLETFDINTRLIEQYLEEHGADDICAILPVHLMGFPANLDELQRICHKYDLVLFEDTAQAHGTKYNGKNTGSFGLLADYSFYIAHNIQVGEMGAVITDDPKINKLIKKIKANGRMCDCDICTRSKGFCQKSDLSEFDPRFSHDMLGYNFKTMEFQAALGLLQLEEFDEIIEKRRNNVEYLKEKLAFLSSDFILPIKTKDISFLAFPMIIKSNINREFLRQKLAERGIESRPLFGSIPTQQIAYSEYKEIYAGKLPNADYLGNHAFYIGCHQYLEKEDLDYIVECFKTVLEEVTNG